MLRRTTNFILIWSFLAVALVVGNPASAQITWTRTKADPFADKTAIDSTALAIGNDGAWYVGRPQGLAKSADKGATWTVISSTWASQTCFALGFNASGELLASANSASPSIMLLRNGSWIKSAISPATIAYFTGFCIDQTGAVIAYDQRANVYRSTDGGISFSLASAQLANLYQGGLWGMVVRRTAACGRRAI